MTTTSPILLVRDGHCPERKGEEEEKKEDWRLKEDSQGRSAGLTSDQLMLYGIMA